MTVKLFKIRKPNWTGRILANSIMVVSFLCCAAQPSDLKNLQGWWMEEGTDTIWRIKGDKASLFMACGPSDGSGKPLNYPLPPANDVNFWLCHGLTEAKVKVNADDKTITIYDGKGKLYGKPSKNLPPLTSPLRFTTVILTPEFKTEKVVDGVAGKNPRIIQAHSNFFGRTPNGSIRKMGTGWGAPEPKNVVVK